MKRLLPLLCALGGAGLLLWGSRFGRSQGASPSSAGEVLREGVVYRVRARLAPGVYPRMRQEGRRPTEVSRFVSNEAKVAGFRKVFLVQEDPSSVGSYTIIGQYGGGSGSSVLQIISSEEVEAPEEAYVSPWEGPMLDDGLLREEGEAVIQALRESRDPKHLSGFASTLSPEFPIAASLLKAKSELCLQLRSGVIQEDTQKKHDRFATGMASVGVTVPPLTDAAPLSFVEAMNALGVSEGFAPFRYPQTLGAPETVWFGETCYRILRDVADGKKKVGRAERAPEDEAEAREVAALRLTGGVLASMPGLGAGVEMAQYVGACFALMGVKFEPATLGNPGPAFFQAGHLAQLMTKTETLRKTRADLPSEGRVRFDAGLIVAETELLRGAGFAGRWHQLPGSDPAEKAAHLKRFVALAGKAGVSVDVALLDDIISEKPDPRIVYEAALMLTSELVRRSAPEVAEKLGIRPADARAALASVREVSEGVRYLAPDVFRRMGPNIVARELLPPAAMQLAFATMRPERSLVSNKEAAIAKARAIHRLAGEGGDAAKAKAQFDRAKRALDRQKWVDWMRRKRQAESGKAATGIIRS